MAQITSKELSCLSDLLNAEQLLVNKYNSFAEETQDAALKSKYKEIAAKHQQHFDLLYTHLK